MGFEEINRSLNPAPMDWNKYRTFFKLKSGMKMMLYLYGRKDLISSGELKSMFGDVSSDLDNLEKSNYIISVNEVDERFYTIAVNGVDMVEEWILKTYTKKSGKD
jgi:hypothetical protein